MLLLLQAAVVLSTRRAPRGPQSIAAPSDVFSGQKEGFVQPVALASDLSKVDLDEFRPRAQAPTHFALSFCWVGGPSHDST